MPDKKLSILYVFGGERAQGAEIVIERLMSLNAANIDTHLILSPGKFADDLIAYGSAYKITTFSGLKKLNRSSTGKFKFYTRAIRNYVTVSYHIGQYVKRNGIDIVHANTLVPSSYIVPYVLTRKIFGSKIKFLWSDHDLNYFSSLDRLQSKLCRRLYDQTLVVSEAVKRKYNPKTKVKVLYNGLDMDLFKSDEVLRGNFRNNLEFSNDLILIGMAASITPDKGQLDLIKAFCQLVPGFPQLRLVLAGGFATDTPKYSEEVQAAVNNNAQIKYLGHFSNMAAFYNGCDIIINNSNNFRSESLGTTIYEAMSCNKFVVAADTGGTPEIISNAVDGFLFKAESVPGLTESLKHILSNYADLSPIKTAARDKVKQRFDLNKMVDNYNQLISEVMVDKD